MPTRVDIWIKSPTSRVQLLEHLGKHMVAYPLGSVEDKASGQFIGLDPEAETVSLRRYDTGVIRTFDWFTTNFRVSTKIEDPFAELAVGMVRRFEYFLDKDSHPIDEPVTLLGTVDRVTPEAVDLWVRDPSWECGGYWAHLKAEDAAKHSIRPPVSPENGE